LLSAFTLTSVAQTNFYKLSVGGGAGANYSFTDVKKGTFSSAGYVNFDYLLTPFITAGMEIQVGTIKGGSRTKDAHLREFTNGYKSFVINGKVRAGQFTDFYLNNFLRYTKGFYLGTGFGIIQNNMTDIIRVKPDGSNYIFPGKDKSTNIVVPLNFGSDFYFQDKWGDIRYVVNVNFQGNVTFGEGLDGYNDPQNIFKNVSPDVYTYLSVGFRYMFGSVGITDRGIR
jgi:hypothetical protein